MAWRVLQWLARLFLAGLFLYAGYFKVRNPFLFEMAVDSYQLLPARGVIIVARTLPWLEIALGLSLLAGWKLPYFATFTAVLLGFFLATMAIAYSRGIEATCGCFGLGEQVGPRTLARDTGLFAVAVYLAAYSWRRRRSASPVSASPL